MKTISNLTVSLLALMCLTVSAYAQSSLLKYGQAVVTCFSGLDPGPPLTVKNDYVLGIVDVREHGTAPLGNVSNWMPPMAHPATADSVTWMADSMGQVFGVAIDDEGNIYVTATTVYGQRPFGNAGSGGVYKIDKNTWKATPFITTLPSGSGAVVGTSTIPNVREGLGNICFDPNHAQLFVTNFEDGKIYRISKAGVILSVFDPMGADDGTVGFAPKGERLWGIGYQCTEDRLYYAVWEEDASNTGVNTFQNSIRSLEIDAAGEFVATTDQQELLMPALSNGFGTALYNYSNPVSDIAFSGDGRMLLGERTMYNNVGTLGAAHLSRVLEYVGGTGSWGISPPGTGKFSIGGHPTAAVVKANSAGGVDYGYESFNPKIEGPSICDSMVWSTGDALHPAPFATRWYGVQGLRAGGGNASNSIIIDLDGLVGVPFKSRTGDVEVFDDCCAIDPCIALGIDADFTHTSPTISDPSATFTDISTAGTGVSIAFIDWCFPDTTITQGAGSSVTYTYDSTGYYQVCLKAYAFGVDSRGQVICCKDEYCLDIFVPSDTCDYHEAQIGCVRDSLDPLSYTFIDSSNYGTHSVWTIDTAGAQANFFGQGPGHTVNYTFPGPGTYTVCLVSFWHVDSVKCCLDTAYKTIRIGQHGPNPCDTLHLDMTCVRVPGTNGITFTPISNMPLTQGCWSFIPMVLSAMDTTLGMDSTTYFYPSPGVYQVCLIGKWTFADGTTCRDTVCKQVVIPQIISPAPCFNHLARFADTLVNGKILTVTDMSTAGTVSEWDFDAPSGVDAVTGGTGTSATHTYTVPGVYTVCLYSTYYYDPNDSTHFCKDTFCTTVTILPLIKAGRTIEVSPNPSRGLMMIRYPATVGEDVTIRLYSAQGMLRQTNQANGRGTTYIDLSEMEKGMYILEVQSKTYRLTKKVMKH